MTENTGLFLRLHAVSQVLVVMLSKVQLSVIINKNHLDSSRVLFSDTLHAMITGNILSVNK